MYRLSALVCFAVFLNALQGSMVKPPASPKVDAPCSRRGEVVGRDVFAQTFLLKPDDGKTETLPFSRWTRFFRLSLDSRNVQPREIEPTAIRLGDRMYVVLDPSEATAELILVEGVRANQASGWKAPELTANSVRGNAGLRHR